MLYIRYLPWIISQFCQGGRNTNGKLQGNVEKLYKMRKSEMSALLVGEGQGYQESFLKEAIFELDFKE